jgi:hypothetical protein
MRPVVYLVPVHALMPWRRHLPARPDRAIRAHPYWTCFSRALVSALLVSTAILTLVHGAVIAVFCVEWLSGWRQSRNLQIRITTDLRYFDVVWGFGRSTGVLLGLVLTNLFVHPVHRWDPWPTVQWINKLFW